jgi:hypothetical protein
LTTAFLLFSRHTLEDENVDKPARSSHKLAPSYTYYSSQKSTP